MNGAHYFGYALVAISAVFLALHAQQWLDWRSMRVGKQREFVRRQLQRQFVASALIGVVGAAMTLVDHVPRTPHGMTAFVFALLLGVVVIIAIAIADFRATRRMREDEQLDLLADALRQAEGNRTRMNADVTD